MIVFPRAAGPGSFDILNGFMADYFMVQRGLTHAYITENPVELTLTPHVKSRTATGGYATAAGAPRVTQSFRLIEGSSVVITDPARTETGFNRSRDWQLMGEWDALIAVNDTFIYDGKPWYVQNMMPWNGYERRAVVERIGE